MFLKNVEQKKTYSNYRYMILFLLCMCSFCANYYQNQLSPLSTQIIDHYQMSLVEFTSLFSANMLPAIFISIPSGMLVDRIGIKNVVTFSLIISLVALIGRVFVNTYSLLYLCCMLSGLAVVFVSTSSSKIFADWFPKEQLSTAVGILVAVGATGKAIGEATTAMFPSYKMAFTVTIFVQLAMAVIWILFMKEKKTKSELMKEHEETLLQNIKIVVTNRGTLVCACALMCIFGTYITMSAHLPSALINRNMDAVTAGKTASMISLGYLFGSLAVPYLIQKCRYKRTFLSLLALSGSFLAMFAWKIQPKLLLNIAIFLLGICIGSLLPSIISMPILLPGIGPKYAGTAGGILTTLQLAGAVVIPTYIIVPLSGGNYEKMFVYAGICFALVSILSFLLPKGSSPEKKNSKKHKKLQMT